MEENEIKEETFGEIKKKEIKFTSISLKKEVKERLRELKSHPRQSFNEIIEILLDK